MKVEECPVHEYTQQTNPPEGGGLMKQCVGG